MNLSSWKASIEEEHYSLRHYTRYLLRCVRFKASRVPFGGALMCRLVGHRWQSWSTPTPQPGIESLRQLHGWHCTRCPYAKRFGDR